jgi:Ca2+-binding EF-hand superfamily protein
MNQVDANGTGKVDFEAFTQFMVKRTKDNDSPDEIFESFKSIAGDKVTSTINVRLMLLRNSLLRKICARFSQMTKLHILFNTCQSMPT